jgi:hypothetical protein
MGAGFFNGGIEIVGAHGHAPLRLHGAAIFQSRKSGLQDARSLARGCGLAGLGEHGGRRESLPLGVRSIIARSKYKM